jgi:hypothetical protein
MFTLFSFVRHRIITRLCAIVVLSLILAVMVLASVHDALATPPPMPPVAIATAYQQLSFRTLRTYLPSKRPPQEILELNGKNVEIMGFMAALTQLEEIDEFVLSSSPPMNCFCHPPLRVNEVIFVQMKKGKKTEYKGGVVRIRGRLTVNNNVTDEFADIMYTVECDEVL